MKALLHRRFGNPEDVLELVESPLAPLGPHDVTIRVEAAAIHAGDLKNIAGEKLMVRHIGENETLETPLPQIPGIEGVGRISAVGSSVAEFKTGDRVLLPWQCGAWREEINADSRHLHRAPEGDAIQLALLVNAFTADFALRDLAPLKKGDWFVQNSANSNVGRALIKLAHIRGIRTANIVRRESVIPDLKALGADVVLLEGPDLPERMHAETRGAQLMIGLDGVAGAATGQLAECLSVGATVANVGQMSEQPCQIATWILLYRRITIIGYYAGFNIRARTFDQQKQIISELTGLIGSGQFATKIAGSYPLSEYKAAVRHAARGGAERDGKVVFVMPG